MRYSKKFLNERYQSLPESINLKRYITDILGSVETADVIKSITKKHNVDHEGILNEISYVMFRATKPSDFTVNLKANLNLSDEKATAI